MALFYDNFADFQTINTVLPSSMTTQWGPTPSNRAFISSGSSGVTNPMSLSQNMLKIVLDGVNNPRVSYLYTSGSFDFSCSPFRSIWLVVVCLKSVCH